MSWRRVDFRVSAAVALALLLVVACLPRWRAPGESSDASGRLAGSGIAASDGRVEVGAWHGDSLEVGRPEPFEFKEEDAEVKDDSVHAGLAAPLLLEVALLSHPISARETVCFVVAGARPRLRC